MDNKLFVVPYYLKSLCDNEITFERGKSYYLDLADRVKAFSLVGNTLYAEVAGRKIYKVTVTFKYGKVFEHSCDCEAHRNYRGPCKHVIAAILDLNSRSKYFYPGGPEPKDVTFIRGDYSYPRDDLNKISIECFKAIKECYEEEGSIDAAEFYNIVKFNAYDETDDPYFFDGERATYVLKECYALAEKEGVKVDDVDDYDSSEQYVEREIDEGDYKSEEDREIDKGYRDDFDYSED